MSLVPLQVELPQFSRSFSINVPPSGSVLDIKQEISRTCPGNPRVDGQRLIWKGRVLADVEVVEQLWKSPDEPRMVHLAVTPSAWSGPPPENAENPTPSPPPFDSTVPFFSQTPQVLVQNAAPSHSFPIPPMAISPMSIPAMRHTHTHSHPPFNYVHYMHNNAIRTLLHQPLVLPLSPQDMQSAKACAKEGIEFSGRSWPPIFDEEFPPTDGGNQGVRYNVANINGMPFLQLVDCNATPTPAQAHAVKVLTYTFPLLQFPYFTTPGPNLSLRAENPLRITINIANQQHQQPQQRMNPQHPAAPNANGNPALPQLRALPMRALLTPFILLCLRTMLLLYFFSPARKPIFGILLGAWVLYEAWGAVRGAIGDLNDLDRDGARARGPPGARPNGAAPGGAPEAGMFRPQGRDQADVFLNHVSTINLESEARALAPVGEAPPEREPGVAEKAKMFVSLFVLTLHPAVWNKRRAVLKEREGRVRTEANALENAATGQGGDQDERIAQARAQLIAQHERRPRWVRDYIERVRRGEWMED